MNKRLLLVFALVALLVVPFAGVAQGQDEGVFLRYPINPDPEHLNPFTQTTIAIGTINRNIYEGLVRIDLSNGEAIPNVAESWEVSEDGTLWTINLRQGVLFHDHPDVTYEDGSREVTAQDIVWAYHILNTDDETVSQNPQTLDGVVGAEAHRSGEAETIEGIQVVDDYTFTVEMETPYRLFWTVGAGTVPIVSPEAYEQLGEDFDTNPVGTGPFVFQEWLRDDRLTVVANPEYWREGYPKVDGIEFINVPDANTQLLMYREGELDLLFGFPTGQRASIIEEFAEEYNEIPGLNVRYFGFDMRQGFFAENPLVRKAFAHAFNRDLVWNELMEGARFPASLGVLPPSMPASTPATIYDYDLERAAALLEEAGYPGGEGMPELTVYIFGSARDELSFPVLQQDLATLGVTLNIEIEDNSTYWSHIGEDDVLMFLSGWSAGIPDPSDVFDFLFKDGRDDTHYDNPEVNALLEAAAAEFDPVAREALYQEAHDIIMEDSPWIVSAYSKVSWLQKPGIEGFAPGGGGTHTANLLEVQKTQ